MTPDVETIVVGAGVIGLAAGRALAMRGQEVLVLERHGQTGTETSSRNSEVLHAGLYYPPGSLKARLCAAGSGLLARFCRESGVALRRTGKLLVASGPGELPALEAIAANARRNGVTDLVSLSAAEACRLEPALSCAGAVLSPATGILDSHGLMTALEGHLSALGGMVHLHTCVTGLGRREGGGFRLAVTSAGSRSELSARNLVLAAGLMSSNVACLLSWPAGYRPPETYLAKGHYYVLAGPAPFRRLIYPLPEKGGLGIHLTLDLAGRARFGPDVAWTLVEDYVFEDADGVRRAAFERSVRRWWPDLPDGALSPGMTGLRPKLTREGEPAADFAIHGPDTHGVAGLVALYGIESPGLTASLAIGEYVADLLCGNGRQAAPAPRL